MATDVDPRVSETYRFNHPATTFLVSPVEELSTAEIRRAAGVRSGQLDLLLGGPPCQGFSIYAPFRTAKDKRNQLVMEYLRVVKELLPRYVVFENVPGMLSLEGGRFLQRIHQGLTSLGYVVQCRVLLAARYGVPQKRWRLFIIAHRQDMLAIKFPGATHAAFAVANFTQGAVWQQSNTSDGSPPKLRPAVTVREAIGDLPPVPSGGGKNWIPMPHADPNRLSEYQRWARRGAQALWNHVGGTLGEANLRRLIYIRPGRNWTDLPFKLLPPGMQRARRSDHTQRYGRLHPDHLACTIPTKCDPHWGAFFHYTQARIITVREAARLQGFPDRYVFRGYLSWQYEQIGNAVPPLLARAVVASICRSVRRTRAHSIELPAPGKRMKR